MYSTRLQPFRSLQCLGLRLDDEEEMSFSHSKKKKRKKDRTDASQKTLNKITRSETVFRTSKRRPYVWYRAVRTGKIISLKEAGVNTNTAMHRKGGRTYTAGMSNAWP